MAAGPTQNYDDASLGSWRPHPVLAMAVRATVALTPLLLALATGLAAHRWFPPARVGLHPWLWLAVQVACSTVVLVLVARAVRRVLPLGVLLRLTLFLPDRAASRSAVARRRHSPAALHAHLEEGRPLRGADDEAHGAELLGLVARLRAHDRGTFSHSERVQALSALIGTELGLTRVEAAQLGWAALLHDIGKLAVPREILTKPGRPTDEEWRVVACHPEHGEALAAPLQPWLGPWVDAVGQHHERWDGAGYPHGLAGEEISLGARIIAVADAFDVITSARSYKKPLSATAARTELARCAGSQFDPDVVRAFLAVGLGPLRALAGPASLVAAVPGLRSMPWPDLAGAASRLAVGPVTGAASLATGVALVLGTVVPGAPLLAPLGMDGTSVAVAARADAVAGQAGPGRAGATEAAGHQTDGSDPVLGDAEGDRADDDGSVADGASGTDDPAGASSISPTTGASGGSQADVRTTAPARATAPPTSGSAADPAACARARAGAPDLAGAVLSRCDLTGDLRGANLAGADLSGATLTGLDLTGARLNGAKLRGAVVSGTTFDRATLTGADLTGAVLTASSFRGATLGPTTLRGATLQDCVLDPGVDAGPGARPAAPAHATATPVPGAPDAAVPAPAPAAPAAPAATSGAGTAAPATSPVAAAPGGPGGAPPGGAPPGGAAPGAGAPSGGRGNGRP